MNQAEDKPWGIVEQKNERDQFIAFHVVPIIYLDGEPYASGAHELNGTCPCQPFSTLNKHEARVWQHFDPHHPGALSNEEWIMKRREAMKEAHFQGEANAK